MAAVVLLVAALSVSLWSTGVRAQEVGSFVGGTPGPGISIAVYTGGSVEGLSPAAPEAVSFWITSDGQFLGYVAGSPAFVNQAFFGHFADGIPPDTPLIVLTPEDAELPPVATATVNERIATHGFPKLYNQYQGGPPSAPLSDMERLSLWDVITVDAENLAPVEHLFGASGVLRAANPNLVITAYFSAGNGEPTDEGLFGRFNEGLQPAWLLYDDNGELARGFHFESGWVGWYNLTATGIAEYFASFIHRELVDLELFDGIFYDSGAFTQFSGLSYQNAQYGGGRIDLDQDGVAETDQQVDLAMRDGMLDLHFKSRDRWGGEVLVLANGGPGSTPDYVTSLNGNMTECFQSNNGDGGELDQLRNSWSAHMMTYASYALQAQAPRLATNLVCGRHDPDNFALMRFTLASTLLFDGYFGFAGPAATSGDYDSTWWYDEYSVNVQTGIAVEAPEYKGYLGAPLGPAVNATDPTEQLADALGVGSGLVDFSDKGAETKVWRRDFEDGIVIVNPTGSTTTVDLGGTFRKIRGTRDVVFNDGSQLTAVVLQPASGIVLLRP